jgi:hypothetical protein
MADNWRLTVDLEAKVVFFLCRNKECTSEKNARVRLQEVVRHNCGHLEHVLH